MIAFIDDHRGAYGLEPRSGSRPICKVLPIAPFIYRAQAARRRDPAKLPGPAKRGAALMPEIARVFEERFRVFGPRKVWRQLKRDGHDLARCTVARLMRGMGLLGVIRGKPVRTTISDKAAPCSLDHVNRQFNAPCPNVRFVSDFAYVATWPSFVYVAFIIDAYARPSARRSNRWRACALRRPASSRRSAVSATASDNALAESVSGLYKAEVTHRRGPWRSLEAVQSATLEWVDWFNRRRLLKPIGNIPPAETEAFYCAAQESMLLAASLKPNSLRQTRSVSVCALETHALKICNRIATSRAQYCKAGARR